MKAMTQDAYGPLEDVLTIQEVEKPVAGEGEVLLRVGGLDPHRRLPRHARRALCDAPSSACAAQGSRARHGPGRDRGGRGRRSDPLKAGDEVFGWGRGAFAEYACAPAGPAPRPSRPASPFEQAAAVGVSAITALGRSR